MGLHRFKPMPSGRMGIFWALSGIRESAIVEFGCMGHNIYSRNALRRAGIYEGFGASVYTTYVDETDISLGDTSRLDATIRRVIEADAPRVIFLQPSAVPEVIGTDLFAISRLMQDDFAGVRLVALGQGSFAATQHRGVQEALLTLVRELVEDVEKGAGAAAGVVAAGAAVAEVVGGAGAAASGAATFNIIGSCPDLYRYHADAAELGRLMQGAFAMPVGCTLSSDTSITEIACMGAARVNLAIRQEAIPAAEELKHRFGTPYVVGRPYGINGTSEWLQKVGSVVGRPPDQGFIDSEEKLAELQVYQAYNTLKNNAWSYPEEAVLSIGGHRDVVEGIMRFATEEMPLRRGDIWCDCPDMASDAIPYYSESEWAPIVERHNKGYLMFSGEALLWAGKNTQLQVTNPDIGWRIHPYDPPFVGYRGAVNLVNLWANEYALTH